MLRLRDKLELMTKPSPMNGEMVSLQTLDLLSPMLSNLTQMHLQMYMLFILKHLPIQWLLSKKHMTNLLPNKLLRKQLIMLGEVRKLSILWIRLIH
jgi:hypothetical protein